MERVVTALRLIPLPLHGAFELAAGLALMLAPFLLGFEPAGAAAALVLGALVVGVALHGMVAEDGRPPLPVGAHHAFDLGLAVATVAAAAVLALSGDDAAGGALAALGGALLALHLTTRYSLRA